MKDVKSVFEVIRELKYIMNKRQQRNGIYVVFLLIVNSFLELLGVSVILPLAYALLDYEKIRYHKHFVVIFDILRINDYKSLIVFMVFFIIVVYFVKSGCILLIKYIQERYSCGLKKELSVRMLTAFLHQKYEYYLNVNIADVLRSIFNEVEGSYNMLSTMMRVATSAFGVVVIGIYLFVTDSQITMGLLIVSIICFFMLYFGIRNKTKSLGKKQIELTTEAYKSITQAINGVKEILVMRRQKEFIRKYTNAYEKKRKNDITYNCILCIPKPLIETVFISGFSVVIGIRAISENVVGDSSFVANMAVFAVGAIKILPYISSISSDVAQLSYLRANVSNVYNSLKSIDKPEILRETGKHISFTDRICIQDISWKYEGREKNTLNRINITIRKGESIGIIGESGSGKSTLIDLLLGLYDFKEGRITVDGDSILSNVEQWSKIIGYVPQNVYMLDDTIRNNILFGAEDEDDDMIWDALDKAQIKTFIESLPDKLDTQVGERGVKMSGGQRQRLAIARALYYNPEVVILDEATSALDGETEKALMQSIESLHGIKTMIIIAHRVSTLANCDKIYEIVNGFAIEKNKKTLFI